MARRYMIRIEKEDLEGESLKNLAKVTKLSPEEFKKKFTVCLD